ncbi:hypothetical protein ISCU110981_19385 [Isoptericola cucumis]
MPVGSDRVVGRLFAYAYAFHCCGSARSMTGSTLMNDPSTGS